MQNVERITSVLVLPHPEVNSRNLLNLRPDPLVESAAMREAMKYEQQAGRHVEDVHERDLGYDLSSVDSRSGELRLIEVKGVGEARVDQAIILTPNEHRIAEDRRDCYWLYVVTGCKTDVPRIYAIRDPANFQWQPVPKIDHYTLPVSRLTGE